MHQHLTLCMVIVHGLCYVLCIVIQIDPYKSNISDVSIHVSYHRDEDSPPGTEQQQDQPLSVEGSNIPGEEDMSKMVGSEPVDGEEEASAGQPAGGDTGEKEETSTAVEQPQVEPPKPHADDASQQKADEAPAENLVEETQEKQLPASNEEEMQTESQQTEDSMTMVAENEDEP